MADDDLAQIVDEILGFYRAERPDLVSPELLHRLKVALDALDVTDLATRTSTPTSPTSTPTPGVDEYLICDTCYVDDDDIETDWKTTRKGNLRCRWCDVKNDFYECHSCDGKIFRRTKKWNYRCTTCSTKVPE